MLKFLTGNPDKFREARQILGEIEQVEMDLPEVQSVDAYEVIRAKIVEAKKHLEGNFFITDVSLSFDCLNGLPGPLIKWFVKTIGNEGLVRIVEAFGNSGALAKVVIGFVDSHGKEYFFEGSIDGKIVSPRGKNGFAWDKIFQPKGHSKTFAEMSPQEKNELSMFRIALNKFREFLKKRKKIKI